VEQGAKPSPLCLTRGEFWEEMMLRLGVPVTWIGQSKSRLARLGRTVKELSRSRPDIIQSQHFYTNCYAAAAARIVGISDVGAIRNDGFAEVRANGPVFGRLGLHAPRTIAANSTAAIHNAVQMGVSPARLMFLPNVVDCDHFHPRLRREDGPVRLIAVGRLATAKRFDRLLKAVAELKKRGTQGFRLSIVGDGPCGQQLRRQAEELGLLPSVVTFVGAVADVAPEYRKADVLVLTSDWEGTPNVIIEAMASGLPVVATRVGGVADVVSPGETGFLVQPDDFSSIVASLAEVIHDPALREAMGCRARNFVLENHSRRKLPVVLRELYEAALS
jgi:glycosyltransferase involved in cell wall biosynthesis